VTAKTAEAIPKPKSPALPSAKELVSLSIDRDVLEHFQADGPGWQERINEALRKVAGLRKLGPQDEGIRPSELSSENDG